MTDDLSRQCFRHFDKALILLFCICLAVFPVVRVRKMSEYAAQLHMRALLQRLQNRISLLFCPHADPAHPGIDL